VKHHRSYHELTGFDDGRIAWAVLEDLKEGFVAGLTPIPVSGVMLICNTKLSDHARRYASCRGIEQIGWGYPPGRDLQRMIDDKQFYPITLLKNWIRQPARGW
jgi:hypothetical protein